MFIMRDILSPKGKAANRDLGIISKEIKNESKDASEAIREVEEDTKTKMTEY